MPAATTGPTVTPFCWLAEAFKGGRFMAPVTRLALTPREIRLHQLTWPRQFTGDSVSSRLHTFTIERLARGTLLMESQFAKYLRLENESPTGTNDDIAISESPL